jgi:hypothetical protein
VAGLVLLLQEFGADLEFHFGDEALPADRALATLCGGPSASGGYSGGYGRYDVEPSPAEVAAMAAAAAAGGAGEGAKGGGMQRSGRVAVQGCSGLVCFRWL